MKTEPPKQEEDKSSPAVAAAGASWGHAARVWLLRSSPESLPVQAGEGSSVTVVWSCLPTESTDKEKRRPALYGGPGQCPEAERRNKRNTCGEGRREKS